MSLEDVSKDAALPQFLGHRIQTMRSAGWRVFQILDAPPQRVVTGGIDLNGIATFTVGTDEADETAWKGLHNLAQYARVRNG